MKYACLTHQKFSDHDYQIVPLRLEDIYLIKQWRNEQIDVLRQKEPLTDAMQQRYFEHVITPTFSASKPNQILFSFLKAAKLIGYGGMVHVDWDEKQAEVSFLVETEHAQDPFSYRTDFSSFLKLLKQAAFKDLKFNRLFTETYEVRRLHISVLEGAGFKEEKRLKDWVEIKGKLVDALIHGCKNDE